MRDKPSTPLARPAAWKSLQSRNLRVIDGNHDLANGPVGDALASATLDQQLAAAHTEFGFLGILRVVQPCVNDLAVAAADPAAEAPFPFDHEHLSPGPSQRCAHRQAHDAGTDHEDLDVGSGPHGLLFRTAKQREQ